MFNFINWVNPLRFVEAITPLRRASQSYPRASLLSPNQSTLIGRNNLRPLSSSAYHPVTRTNSPETPTQRLSVRTIPFKSDSTYQNFRRMGWFNIWAGIGGLALGAVILKNEFGEVQRAYCDEGPPRAASVDYLEDNDDIEDPISMGLVFDEELSRRMSTATQERKFYKTKNGSRFRAELFNGQLFWISFEKVYLSDVEKVAEFYKNLRQKRSLHINTGIHGTSTGQAAVDEASGNFTLEDITKFRTYPVSFHIVSSHSSPLTHRQLPRRDLLNAWCYSEKTHDFTMGKRTQPRWGELDGIVNQSLPINQIIGSFSKGIGYRSPITPQNKYVEFGDLKAKISSILEQNSFCYIEGMGGSGKSRTAFDIQKEINQAIQDRASEIIPEGSGGPIVSPRLVDGSDTLNNMGILSEEFFETVFITLRSNQDKEQFIQHARKLVGDSDRLSDEVLVEKYFELLGNLANRLGKKVFVVIDNIDTPEDLEWLEKIYPHISKSQVNGHPTFKLIVTGRMDPTVFLQQQNMISQDVVIKIEKYCTDPKIIWKLFSETFLTQCSSDISEEERENYLGPKQRRLSRLFQEYGNHPGFTILLAQNLFEAYRNQEDLKFIEEMTTNFHDIIRETTLSDYKKKFSKMVQQPLKRLDQKYDGIPSKMCRVLALISDGSVSNEFFRLVMERYCQINHTKLMKIRKVLEDCGFFTREDNNTLLVMRTFYNRIMRDHLAEEFKTNKEDVAKIVEAILVVITYDTDIQFKEEKVHQRMSYLWSILNYVKNELRDDELLGNVNESLEFFVRHELYGVRYSDLSNKYRSFFRQICGKAECIIHPVLRLYVACRDLTLLTDDIIKKAHVFDLPKSELSELFSKSPWMEGVLSDVVCHLNNIYSINANLNDNEERSEEIRVILKELCANLPDYVLRNKLIHICEMNTIEGRKKEDLLIIPEVYFLGSLFSPEANELLERLLRGLAFILFNPNDGSRNGLISPINGMVDYSDLGINEELNYLAYHLFEMNRVSAINLDRNDLGCRQSGLYNLLRYPGSLKELSLNYNSLGHKTEGMRKPFYLFLRGLFLNHTLEVLHLQNNDFEDEHIEQLRIALKDHPTIREIYLDENPFSEKSTYELRRLMKENQNIQLITIKRSWSWSWFRWAIGDKVSKKELGKKIYRDENGKIKIQ